jgi:hypothetical protein
MDSDPDPRKIVPQHLTITNDTSRYCSATGYRRQRVSRIEQDDGGGGNDMGSGPRLETLGQFWQQPLRNDR